MTDAPHVSLRGVGKRYPPRAKGEQALEALSEVDLDIRRGEVFGIIGYSGAGKSTLVRLVNALERPTAGTVSVDGREIQGLPERELRKLRLGIGMVFQQFNLFTSKTVWGNVAYPLTVAGMPKDQQQRRISDLLHFVGLADKAHARPDELSGGQKQRVGIARALATSPAILLADEATSALDPETTSEVLALLRRVNEELGVTIVVITHEMEVIKSIAHRVAVMDSGRVIEQGEVFDVFSRPTSDAARRFVSTVVAGVPEAEEVQRLRRRHPGRLVTLSFADGGATQAEVFQALAAAGIAFEVVHGGITDIQGRTFGNLTLALGGDPARIDEVLAADRAGVTVTEVV
ncbi:methionine ABC transporter ATP-binding protein [Clavibacter michiganensis subsp. phaseoli]|uniref:methionine ABC transporter ATP-binding protein n=1 Tax=Clavibacter phaseoli TaxID=1734031 RepID=UPI001FB4276F|nr:methionine ABC transporter ATP-binding protein [Clavibacter phaseoli]MCJ1711990.1 methionine ABC transporter ATP-binding protein [Clavibacter phaseoli]